MGTDKAVDLWQEPPERAWAILGGGPGVTREMALEMLEWDEEDDAWKPRRDNPNIRWIET